MRNFPSNLSRIKIAAMFLTLFVLFSGQYSALAGGGDDHSHGDETPTTTTGANGAGAKVTVLHTARLGDFEVSVKHPALAPDTATSARLFVTEFASNAPAGNVGAAVEIESANGSVTQVTAEKANAAGSFNLQIPALPAGTYTLRARITNGGNTDTATFSNLQIQTAAAHHDDHGGLASWLRTALIAIVGFVVLGLFGCLIYFVLRSVKGESPARETVSV